MMCLYTCVRACEHVQAQAQAEGQREFLQGLSSFLASSSSSCVILCLSVFSLELYYFCLL